MFYSVAASKSEQFASCIWTKIMTRIIYGNDTLIICQHKLCPFPHNLPLIYVIFHHLSCLMTKPTKWHVCSVKAQISLGISPVWSESSLSARKKLGSLVTHWAHSEDSDETGRMPRLIWVFTGRTGRFVGFVMRWPIWAKKHEESLADSQ